MERVSKVIPPQKTIIKNIYLSFFYGAKIGVLGLNGSGKSTLLRIIAGIDKSYTGDVVFSPGYTVGLLEQEPQLDPNKTVIEVVEEAVVEIKNLLKEFDEINEAFADPDADFDKLLARQGEVQEKLDHFNAWELDTRLEKAMDALRCPPSDALVSTLSGGEKRRVALCRLLLQEPDVLLLDEPTNHLDAESVDWLEQHLRQYKGTVIAVTHDRYFLDNVAGWILELDRGEGIPWKGNYSSWLEQKQNRLAQEEKTESRRQKTLQRELEWVRMAPKARQAKSKARIGAYEKLLSEENKQKEDKLELFIPAGPRLGNKVIEVQGVSKSFGDKLLYENLSFSLPPAGIVGIIGPNGAGKTTCFNLLTKFLEPSSGQILFNGFDITKEKPAQIARRGVVRSFQISAVFPHLTVLENVRVALQQGLGTEFHFWKSGDSLNVLNERAEELLCEVGLADFAHEETLNLAYGRKRALEIATTMAMEPELMLLDEPTQGMGHEDVERVTELIDRVAKGRTILMVEHNMKVVSSIADRITVLQRGSVLAEGSYREVSNNPLVVEAYMGSHGGDSI